MKTGKFLSLLEKNPTKELVFEYREKEFIPKNFHITEVKSKHIESVDCGGYSHDYDETVVQLWTPSEEKKEIGMDASKALKIFNIVDGKKPLKRDTPIFFEWGYGYLPTSVYEVKVVENEADKLVVKMFVPPTVCKPKQLLQTVQNVTGTNCCGDGEKVGNLIQSARKCC